MTHQFLPQISPETRVKLNAFGENRTYNTFHLPNVCVPRTWEFNAFTIGATLAGVALFLAGKRFGLVTGPSCFAIGMAPTMALLHTREMDYFPLAS